MAMIFNDLAAGWRRADMLLRLIYINLAVFVAIILLKVGCWLVGTDAAFWLIKTVKLPSQAMMLLWQPWTCITYMFAHEDPLHLIFNMLWLYWMGHIFLDFFSQKQIVGLYLLGGLGGAILYLLAYSLLPPLAGSMSMMLGASAAVMAICGAVATYVPNYRIGLLFFGNIALKWVALALVVLDLAGISGDNNVGGHIAHLGGLAIGVAFTLYIRRGRDITAWLNILLDRLCSNRAPRRQQQRNAAPRRTSRPANTTPSEAQIDAVLDKIRRSGYASLTDEERQILMRASRNH